MADDSFLDSSEDEDGPDPDPQSEPAEVAETPEPKKVAAEPAKPAEKAPAKGDKPPIKPIKDRGPKRATLPGVIGTDPSDLFGKAPKDDVKRLLAKQEAKERANRDDVDDDAIVRPLGEAAPAKTPEPGKEPAAAKFKFADEEYDTQEAAEQRFKSLQGMFRPLKESADLSQHNFKASQSWMETAKAALAGTLAPEQAASLRQQLGIVNAPAPRGHHSVSGAAKDSEDLTSGIDMGAFEILAMDPQAGLGVAGKYLIEETLRKVKEDILPRLREEIQAEYKPLLSDREQSRGEAEIHQAVEAVLGSVSAYQLPGTSDPAFPELQDPVAVAEIGRIWAALGRPREELMQPSGLIQAVANYRIYHPRGASPTAEVPRPAAPAPGAAASLSDGGRGGGAGATRQAASGMQTLRDRLMDTKMLDSTLGFAKNRRQKGIE